MVYDKNGTLIKAGDIVKIEDAYFKNDNGYWLVEEDGTDPAYLDKDGLTLKGIGKTGKLITSKYRTIAFWPLIATCSDREKAREAKTWNAENATIEIVHNVDNGQAIEWLKEEIKKTADYIEWHKLRGYPEGFTEMSEGKLVYLNGMLDNMTA